MATEQDKVIQRMQANKRKYEEMIANPKPTEKDGEFTTYYGSPIRKGIDDLKSIYAFHGNSQGDNSISNSIETYKASQGWMSYSSTFEAAGINIDDQEAINKYSEELRKQNEKYIEELKLTGEYGYPTEGISLTLKHFPLYDDNNYDTTDKPIESYKMTFIDLGNNEN
jgi:hypothetical protein